MYPYWDDLDINPATTANAGVYTRVDGTAPNRVYTIEWFNAGHFADVANQTITFQVRLYETSGLIQYKYLDVIFGGTQATSNSGLSATTGLEGVVATPRPATQVGFNTAYLTDGQCIQFQQPPPCLPVAGANITVSTDPGTCSASPAVNLPSFNPAGCANGTSTGLRYSVNGGPFTVVPPPYTGSITLTGVSQGNYVITWQTFVIATGGANSQATQTVTVQDEVDPVITCPQNVTLNLGPGECETIYSYNVTATDNCPFFIQAPEIQFPATIFPHGGGAISVAGNTLPGGFWFNLRNDQANPITINGYKIRFGTSTFGVVPSPQPVNTYYTTSATTYVGNETNAANWTSSGTGISVVVAGANSEFSQVTLPQPFTLQPGQQKGIYIHGVTASVIYNSAANSNANPITIGGLTLTPGRAGQNLFSLTTSFTPRTPNVVVQYGIAGDLTPVLLPGGIASGGVFPVGTTTNCFITTDVAGNTATCCFDVTVKEYAPAVTALTCNDLVQISLDASCTATIGADQVLEGGPYGCYDEYVVELDKIAPYGNGPWDPAVLGPDDVGKTYGVRVTDPATGNKCWGTIKVEDKLPPVLDCQPYQLYCHSSLEPCQGDGPPLATFVQFPATIFPHGGGAISVAGNNLPGGFLFNLRNDGIEDLIITGYKVRFGTSTFGVVNSPQAVNTYYTTAANTYLGNQTNAGAWTSSGVASVTVAGPNSEFSQVSLSNPFVLAVGQQKGIYLFGVNASLVYNSAGNSSAAPITMAPLTLTPGEATGTLFTASGLTPRTPNVQVQFAPVNQASPCLPNGLVLNETAFPIGGGCYNATIGAGDPVLEPCSDVTLCYIDTYADQNCASGLTRIVNRKWTATDASGNSATCIQVISLVRPTLADVIVPPNYDDIDEPALPCSSAYPTPDYLDGLSIPNTLTPDPNDFVTGQGYPYVFGQPDGCSISWTYVDNVVDVCDGTYKILREWKIIDWCTSGIQFHNQIIKVLDGQDPSMNCPAQITVSTDPFTCCATADLPDVIIEDGCSRIASFSAMVTTFDPVTQQQTGMYQYNGSLTDFPGNNKWDPDTLGVMGDTPCLPLGTHTVLYTAEDDCGNTSTCSFRIIVRDYTAPVAACDEYTVVGIGVDDPLTATCRATPATLPV
ncbi:MAG: HYR domain-containing protein [Saprospirales bacterium]|nr:HYR domain-containing protein [Saprospirales bacterium]